MSDLKLFEDLIALAQTGSFVRAAERRHVTHPAFGRRIKALEAWAGAPLLERNRIPVSLTPQGEALLKTAIQVVEQMGMVRHRIRSSGSEAEAVLRIATGRSLARTQVAEWIARLRKKTAPHSERFDAGRYRHRHDARYGKLAGARPGRFIVLL